MGLRPISAQCVLAISSVPVRRHYGVGPKRERAVAGLRSTGAARLDATSLPWRSMSARWTAAIAVTDLVRDEDMVARRVKEPRGKLDKERRPTMVLNAVAERRLESFSVDRAQLIVKCSEGTKDRRMTRKQFL